MIPEKIKNIIPFQPDRRIGSVYSRHRYDLPLERDEGTGFILLLMALMTFLATVTLAGALGLNDMASRWSSGLENKLTIEIPAEDGQDNIRSPEDIRDLAEKAEKALNDLQAVQRADILSDDDIQALITPWLGEDTPLDDLPMPGMLEVEMSGNDKDALSQIKDTLRKISPDIQADGHEDWLNDILRMTGALQILTLIVTLIIGGTTITAIAGAVRARMAIHKSDVELLHLMGASDEYITRQFQRHAFILAVKGGLMGLTAGIISIWLIGLMAGTGDTPLLPDVSFSFSDILYLIIVPALICIVASSAARFTVLRVLAQMP